MLHAFVREYYSVSIIAPIRWWCAPYGTLPLQQHQILLAIAHRCAALCWFTADWALHGMLARTVAVAPRLLPRAQTHAIAPGFHSFRCVQRASMVLLALRIGLRRAFLHAPKINIFLSTCLVEWVIQLGP